MAENKKEDLRVQRTKEFIRKTFEEMICEMDYEQISVKELTQRAKINRKTFYLHYNTLDDLLLEIQNEMAQNFIRRTQGLERPRDMDKITREFFLCSEDLGKLGGTDHMQRQLQIYQPQDHQRYYEPDMENRFTAICRKSICPEYHYDICGTKHFGNL